MSAMHYTTEYWKDVDAVTKVIPNRKALWGKTVLITGASGLICSAVTDILSFMNREQDAAIRIILAGRSGQRIQNRFSWAREGRDYTFLPFDATQGAISTTYADYIIHGAGNADPASVSRQPVETMLSNILGLNALLRLAADTGTKRLLYISSSEVYGQRLQAPYHEDDQGYVDILNPRACYPSAKRAAETLCISYGAEYGVDTVMVRPGHVYGPGMTDSDSRAASQFLRLAAAGQNIVMKSAGTQRRSHCHSLDCASAILTVLLNGEKGNAYNISNRDAISTVWQFAEAAVHSTGVEIRFETPTDQEKRSYNMMDDSTLDAEKLERLGWKGIFDLQQGVSETIRALNRTRKAADQEKQSPGANKTGASYDVESVKTTSV